MEDRIQIVQFYERERIHNYECFFIQTDAPLFSFTRIAKIGKVIYMRKKTPPLKAKSGDVV